MDNKIEELDDHTKGILSDYRKTGKVSPDFLPITTYDMIQSGYPTPHEGIMIAREWGGTDADGHLLPSTGMWCKVEDVKNLLERNGLSWNELKHEDDIPKQGYSNGPEFEKCLKEFRIAIVIRDLVHEKNEEKEDIIIGSVMPFNDVVDDWGINTDINDKNKWAGCEETFSSAVNRLVERYKIVRWDDKVIPASEYKGRKLFFYGRV